MSTTSPIIGILGGTGALGRGLAYRWAKAGLPVVIGSRREEGAQDAAAELRDKVGGEAVVSGAGLLACAQQADVIVIAVPWDAHNDTVLVVASALRGKVVLDVVSPLAGGPGGIRAIRPDAGSASEEAQQLLPESHVVGGFHHVSAVKLSDADRAEVDSDVMLVGDVDAALTTIEELVAAIPGMRGIRAGKLATAAAVEGLTANLIAVNRRYKTHAGVRVTGIA